jgi:hypothetical protein
MPARVQLTRRRERRLLKLIECGATVAEACRAVEITRKTIYRHARADMIFAERLRAARERRQSPLSAESALAGWREIAARLEREYPERWASFDGSTASFDAFDFDPLA